MKRAVLFLTFAFALSGCANCGNTAPCGSGTIERDGECVPADEACGPGTTLDDDGRCVVAMPTTCGVGTQRDANTGMCVATDEVCGANTAFDMTTGTCRPTEDVCVDGTVYNPEQGQCTPEARCRPGDVVLDGLCVPVPEALARDPDLVGTENDDPEYSGQPNVIELAEFGEQFVFVGTIDTPEDLDLDGERDQDVDVYEFEANSGDWIYVTLQPLGAPALAYAVSGPPGSGFTRLSPLDGEAGSARGFVTTIPGRYRIFVAPTTTFLGDGGGTLGSPNFDYVGTIERRAAPEPMQVNVAAGVDATAGDPAENFFTDPGFNPSSMGELAFESWGSDVEAEISLWDGDRFLASRRISSPVDFPMAVPDTGTIRFLVDWVRIDGPERDYRITGKQGASLIQLGELAAGTDTDADAVELQGFQSTWFAFTVEPGEVVELSQDNSDGAPVTMELLDAAGSLITDETLEPRPLATGNVWLYHPALLGGTFLVRIRTASTVRAFSPRIGSVTPEPLTVDANAQSAAVQTLMLPDSSQFALVRFADGDIAEFSQSNNQSARVPLHLWNGSWTAVGEAVDLAPRSGISDPKYLYRYERPDQVLVEYRNDTAGDLEQVSVRLNGLSPFDLGTLQPGAEVSEGTSSTLARGRRAFFAFEFTEELLVEGAVDAFGADVDISFRRPNGTLVFGSSTNGAEEFVTALAAGPYVVEVKAIGELPVGFDFDMSVLGFPQVREAEPNDNFLDATTTLDLGGTIGGTYPNNGSDADFFEVEVTSPAFYSFSVLTFPTNTPTANLYNSDGEVIIGRSLTPVQRLRTFLESGTYYLELVGDGFAPQEIDYVIRSTVESSNATVLDAAGNDTPATAISLPASVGAIVDGVVEGSRDIDYFEVDLAQATDFYAFRVAPSGGVSSSSVSFLDSSLAQIPFVNSAVTLPAGTSYMRVSGFTPGGPNDYRVRFTSAPDVYNASPGVVIPSGGWPQVTVREEITATQPCTIGQVWVDVDITHTFIGDLYVDLTGPGGQTVSLWYGTGGSVEDLVGTFPIDLQPVDDLGIFVGTEGAGDWTLDVGDQFVSDGGTLESWGIRLFCQ